VTPFPERRIDMRLLIVDDDMPTVEAIRRAIDWEAVGIEAVETAYGAAQARRVLRCGHTDIVISDIEMPQGSGLDLLSWVRAQGLDVEFLFLTCHERFDYAKSALKLEAAEYLTKPFNAKLMALSLQKTVAKIRENRRLREGRRYGEWRLANPRQEERNFWLALFSGDSLRDRELIRREIDARGLPVEADARYRLVATRVMEFEPQARELGRELLYFILENTHSRILTGREENSRAVRRLSGNGLWFFTAVEDAPDETLRARCEEVIAACGDAARVKATCCIGDAVPIEALADKPAALQALIERSVAFYAQAFLEGEAVTAGAETQVLEIGKLEEMLLNHDKVRILNAVKRALASRTALKTLSERTLFLIQQEILQAVYAHLAQTGLQAARLFSDDDSVRLADAACRSGVDMLRWANYLLERAFEHEDEARRAGGLVERIHAFIREHYREDIGRNEIAAAFFLSPEYLAKLYKKKTSKTLGDAIREQRVEQARRLLRDPGVRIGDVAGAVGIDNFSYFTTLFKKEVGVTPQEYRRDAENGRI
jgi:two-component system, response regulator YesN